MNTFIIHRSIAHCKVGAAAALLMLLTVCGIPSYAGTANSANTKSNGSEEVQRDAPSGAFDLQRNVVSNIDFFTSNYGIFGFNIRQQIGGTFWPRGTGNQYLFAGGAWFGALKRPPGTSDLRKRVMITYNPNSGQSWMVPGSIADGNAVDQGDGVNKNRIYFSTDANTADGSDLTHPTFPKWPVWDASPSDTLRYNNYYGLYINNTEDRTRTKYPKGPAFVSQEDIFAVYKDTDLSRYEGGALRRQAEGFPLGLQIEQMIYSWGFGDYADFVFLKYMFIHPDKFTDTLYNCWMAGVMDVDIGLRTNSSNGAQNDRARYYSEEDTLNLAVQWSNADRGEANQGFGYLGFNFLESPAVDVDGFIRKDKKQFPVTDQLGLRTMRNWPIAVDPIENEDRYNFMSSQDLDGDQGPGDRRLLMATGPFNMRPGDSARIVVGIILAGTAGGKDATGTAEDMAELIRKVRFAQFVYNNQFRAPQAPALPVIRGYESTGSLYSVPPAGWLPLNNAIAIQWDSTSEMSVDTLEAGMDFLGYRIYRARRTDLDTFSRDLRLTDRMGPLAWKQIGQFGVVPPFVKTSTTIGTTGVPIDDFIIADVIKPGQKKILVARTPTFALPWAGYFNDLINKRKPASVNSDSTLDIGSISKYDSVIFTYMTVAFDTLPTVRRVARGNAWGLDSVQAKIAKDSLITLIKNKKVKSDPILFKDNDPDFAPGVIYRPWEETVEVRGKIVAPFMHDITSGRQFYDEGDDDKNGDILYDPDPEQTEKLINNIDYYYAIRPYDEGDYLQATEGKLGLRGMGLVNTVSTMPLASRPTTPTTVEFRVEPQDQAKMGGIYNIKLLVTDQQRFAQLFAGKTLQLEFFRNWFAFDHDRDPANGSIGLYGLTAYLKDSATQAQIGVWSSALPPQLCGTNSLAAFFTENTVTWVDTAGAGWKVDKATGLIFDTVFAANGSIERIDTTDFQLANNTDKILRSGTFTSDASCFSGKYALGTVGLSFDFTIEQWGGAYRALDSAQVEGGDPNIFVGNGKNIALTYNDNHPLNQPGRDFTPPYPGWQPNAAFMWPTSYNNGPGVYEITFEEGGTETITTSFRTKTTLGDDSDDGKISTFENVPYLKMRMRNIAQYERPDVHPDGTITSKTVSYPFDYTNTTFALSTPDQVSTFPNPELVPIDGFAVAAYGWRNPNRGAYKSIDIQYFSADSNRGNPVGDMGKYYISKNVSRDGKDTLYFTHVITVGGAQYCIDFSRFGGRNNLGPNRTVNAQAAYHGKSGTADPTTPTQDFKPGDKVRFFTYGGALGFPFDHAKAYAKVNATGADNVDRVYTDEEMEQIQVVPNPYYVTHEGIQSPYQGKLYFTRLPRKCTINIYTTNGDLINTFHHDESTSESPSTFATFVWDLLSKNRQRVASQTLLAKIETPEGATVVRKFTIVVGPARIVTEE